MKYNLKRAKSLQCCTEKFAGQVKDSQILIKFLMTTFELGSVTSLWEIELRSHHTTRRSTSERKFHLDFYLLSATLIETNSNVGNELYSSYCPVYDKKWDFDIIFFGMVLIAGNIFAFVINLFWQLTYISMCIVFYRYYVDFHYSQ